MPRPYRYLHMQVGDGKLTGEGNGFFRVFSSGGVLELLNVSSLPACSHYPNCIVFEFDEMLQSIPSFKTEF